MNKLFTKVNQDSDARAGILHTRRGDIETPFFMSVATRATIKGGVDREDLLEMGAPVVLSNTYHLSLRPGGDVIEQAGGLHDFMHWDGPILTDSGGFQVFSLGKKKITDEGVWFHSHIDGKRFWMDAEASIRIQNQLGADIVMAFDECPPSIKKSVSERDLRKNYFLVRSAVDRTTDWAKRSLAAHHSFISPLSRKNNNKKNTALIFGIIQGGLFSDLRRRSLDMITSLPFDGFALGGLAVGEEEEDMYSVLDECVSLLPPEKARYLMGVGTPVNLLKAIKRGIDMFDCVMPMRNARHGTVFTRRGPLKIRNECYISDNSILDESCSCSVCKRGYTRSYLRHLISVGEDTGKRLLTIHNLFFYHNLMRQARQHILTHDFSSWQQDWIERYQKT